MPQGKNMFVPIMKLIQNWIILQGIRTLLPVTNWSNVSLLLTSAINHKIIIYQCYLIWPYDMLGVTVLCNISPSCVMNCNIKCMIGLLYNVYIVSIYRWFTTMYRNMAMWVGFYNAIINIAPWMKIIQTFLKW
jgi:hypothetical protein